jgi:hypothetical protein
MKPTLLLSILIAINGNVMAQDAFRNTGNMQLHSGAALTGFGNFINTSSAVLVNNGSINIKGNLSNDQASMSAGTGTLLLTGSSSQSISGSQSVSTFNFVSDNSTGITLNNNLNISGTHTFVNGLITTSATPNYLIYEAGSSYSGSNDSRHINGWVKKNGNTNFVFPVGDNTYERSVAISNLSASSEINCHYYTPTPNTNNLFSPLVQVKGNEYWQLDKISGGTGQITINWNHAKVLMDHILVPDILTAQYSSGNWGSIGGTASGNVTTTGTITSDATSSFGQITFGYTTFPVPLKLISFTAERRTGTSYLTWITENEENVDHFDVQRSYNANNFSTIGNVTARNTGTRQIYNFQDHSTLDGLAYYRIKSIDRDGKFSYSKTVVVAENNLQATSFYVLNPARSTITVFNKTGRDGQFEYRLFSVAGQLLLNDNVQMSNNGGAVLPLPAITANGIYILELSNQTIRFRQQILIEK